MHYDVGVEGVVEKARINKRGIERVAGIEGNGAACVSVVIDESASTKDKSLRDIGEMTAATIVM